MLDSELNRWQGQVRFNRLLAAPGVNCRVFDRRESSPMNKLFISLSSLSSASVAPGGWWSAGRRMTLRWPSLTLASLLSLALAGWGLPGALGGP